MNNLSDEKQSSNFWSSNNLSLLGTVWEDINHEAEAIVISEIKYEPGSLSNSIYEVIDDKEKRRKLIKNSKVKGLYADLNEIRSHRDIIDKDDNISMLVQGLFKKEEVDSITSLDRLFLNSYYRRLLRAKLERDYIGKELVTGLVITEYTNSETDENLVKTMILFRIICKFLGITSTTHAETFPIEKLYNPAFWSSISNKFIKLFGENRVPIIEIDDPLPSNNLEAIIMHEKQKQIRQAQVLMMLNIIFNAWSGSTLVADNDKIKIIPATYISRMLSKLR
jgi:hypothetical protein